MATVRSSDLLAKFKLEDLDLILRERLLWFGHVGRSSGAIIKTCHIQTDGRQGAGGREVQANMEETDGERLP